jgi:phytoene synthase
MPIARDWDAASAALVTDKVRQSGTSFYWGMRLLEPRRRLAMYAIYAFCREVDDIADGDGSAAEKLAGLSRWRSEIDALYDGHPTLPLSRTLAGPIVEFGLRREDFIAVVAGCESDANCEMLRPSMAALELYCDRVACAVGRLSIRIFGEESDRGIRVADALGRALQLTNILRDVEEDAAIGRLYLPDEVLSRHGIEGVDLKAILAHPALPDVRREIAVIARQHFADAAAAMALCARKPMRPAALMRITYLAILNRLDAAGWKIGCPVPKVPKPLKIWYLLRYGLI